MPEKFQQPFLKLERIVKRGQKNEENGLWEFMAVAPAERLPVWVSEQALSALLDIPVDRLDDGVLLQNIERIEALVANAEFRGWPKQLGVFRE